MIQVHSMPQAAKQGPSLLDQTNATRISVAPLMLKLQYLMKVQTCQCEVAAQSLLLLLVANSAHEPIYNIVL